MQTIFSDIDLLENVIYAKSQGFEPQKSIVYLFSYTVFGVAQIFTSIV